MRVIITLSKEMFLVIIQVNWKNIKYCWIWFIRLNFNYTTSLLLRFQNEWVKNSSNIVVTKGNKTSFWIRLFKVMRSILRKFRKKPCILQYLSIALPKCSVRSNVYIQFLKTWNFQITEGRSNLSELYRLKKCWKCVFEQCFCIWLWVSYESKLTDRRPKVVEFIILAIYSVLILKI
jgi:hypothetical protein